MATTARRRRCSSLLGAVSLLLAVSGCDTFFELDLVVTDCPMGQPLMGVLAMARSDTGDKESHQGTTDAAGKVFLSFNKPDDTTVTLTLTKAGYRGWTKEFRGEPMQPYPVCLQPTLP